MQATVKPVRVRMYVYCSTEAFAQLNEMGRRWMDCIAAQQSNIVNDAEQTASASQRRAPADYLKHRTNWDSQNKVDAARLRRLIHVWPELSHRKQAELVEHIQTVVGR